MKPLSSPLSFPRLNLLLAGLAASLLPMAEMTASLEYRLVWADEFDQPDGSLPDPANWDYNIGRGANGWGNGEWQYYTDRAENARIENGQLVIEAHKETFEGALYTSARLLTKGKHAWTYGRFEARIKLPPGAAGLWPAFWMLGSNIDTVGWPRCGEIDIMEYVSRLPNEIYGTIHGPGYSAGNSFGNAYDFGEPAIDQYHVYAVEWQPGIIRWYVDDILYHTAKPEDIVGTGRQPNDWVFDHDHFIILNLAIGGTFAGLISPELVFPTRMLVDYVRVYSADYGMFNTFPRSDSWIDSGEYMGWVNVADYPWVWVSNLQKHIYAAPSDQPEGWIYVPK